MSTSVSDRPQSLGMKSAPQPPLGDRGNSYLTSHLSETDIEEICSLSSAALQENFFYAHTKDIWEYFLFTPPKHAVLAPSISLCVICNILVSHFESFYAFVYPFFSHTTKRSCDLHLTRSGHRISTGSLCAVIRPTVHFQASRMLFLCL